MYPGNWAEFDPGRAAIVDADTGAGVSYADLDRRSSQLARYFRTVGLATGDHIAILMANCPEYLEAAWAAQRSGLYYTPINSHLTLGEMRYIVDDCGAKVLVVGHEHASVADELTNHAAVRMIVCGGTLAGADNYEEVVAALPADRLDDEAEGFGMFYTSGTTGYPKGGTRPLLQLRPFDGNPRLVESYHPFSLDEHSVYLTPGAPLYHAAPLRFSMALHRLGGTCVIMRAFDPLRALEVIERHRVTHSQWVPTMFVRLLRLSAEERSRFDLTSHRVAIHAAAPCPPSVKNDMLGWWGPIIHEYYGASECGIITYIGPEDWLSHPGSVGRPVTGAVHILDGAGELVRPGETGAVYVEGGVPIRYHRDDKKTAAAYTPQGWATVGDVGRLDADGFLYLVDRCDNLILSGGVNIYPQEAEDVLIRHPAVADVAVIGVPNDEFGQEAKAVVQPVDMGSAGSSLERELIEFCRGQIAAFKCPRSVDFEAELPRAPSGKLYKRRLLDRYWLEQPTATSAG